MAEQVKIVFVLGPPGSGKGAQCDNMVKKYGYVHLSVEDLLQKEINEGSDLGRAAEEMQQQGEMVATELILELVASAMQTSGGTKFLLDGFPRQLDQLLVFQEEVQPCDAAILFTVPDDVLMERAVAAGRGDAVEATPEWLEAYTEQTTPIMDALREAGIPVFDIDASGSNEETFMQVAGFMDELEGVQEEEEEAQQATGSSKPITSEEVQAAVTIQAAGRGYIARKQVKAIKDQRATSNEAAAEEPAEAEEAAVAETKDDEEAAAEDTPAPLEDTPAAVEDTPAAAEDMPEAADAEEGAAEAEERTAAAAEDETPAVENAEDAAAAEEDGAAAEESTAAAAADFSPDDEAVQAAIKVQAAARGMLARKQVREMKQQRQQQQLQVAPAEDAEAVGEVSGVLGESAGFGTEEGEGREAEAVAEEAEVGPGLDDDDVAAVAVMEDEVSRSGLGEDGEKEEAAVIVANEETLDALGDLSFDPTSTAGSGSRLMESAVAAETEATAAEVTAAEVTPAAAAAAELDPEAAALLIQRAGRGMVARLQAADIKAQKQEAGVAEVTGQLPAESTAEISGTVGEEYSADFEQPSTHTVEATPEEALGESLAMEEPEAVGEAEGEGAPVVEEAEQKVEGQQQWTVAEMEAAALLIQTAGRGMLARRQVTELRSTKMAAAAAAAAASEAAPAVVVEEEVEAEDRGGFVEEEAVNAEAEAAAIKIAQLAEAIPSLLVVCGPSGVGKGTLINLLMKQHPAQCGFVVSHTTRSPRPGEEDGVHYHFTSRDEMEKQIAAGLFLEFAAVHSNLYGTSLAAVAAVCSTGRVPVLDIDVQGAAKVRASAVSSKAMFVFISPPSLAELEARLRGRGTETEDKVTLRLNNAAAEMSAAAEPGAFDVVIVNDSVEDAVERLKGEIEARFPGTFSSPAAETAAAEVVVAAEAEPVGAVAVETPLEQSTVETEPESVAETEDKQEDEEEETEEEEEEEEEQEEVAEVVAPKPTTPPPPPPLVSEPLPPLPSTPPTATPAPPSVNPVPPTAPVAPVVARGGATPTVRQYMDSTVVPVLREALRDLNEKRPTDPLGFLASFLLAARDERAACEAN